MLARGVQEAFNGEFLPDLRVTRRDDLRRRTNLYDLLQAAGGDSEPLPRGAAMNPRQVSLGISPPASEPGSTTAGRSFAWQYRLLLWLELPGAVAAVVGFSLALAQQWSLGDTAFDTIGRAGIVVVIVLALGIWPYLLW